MESAQYLYMDISKMNSFFNWTMTYRRDSDFYRPYGRIVKIKPHPEGEDLKAYIAQFGRDNKHLAKGKQKQAAWFVSHCATQVCILIISSTFYCQNILVYKIFLRLSKNLILFYNIFHLKPQQRAFDAKLG